MSGFFLNIVNMSISASWIVLAVLLLRLLLKKAPKWISVLLWGIVAVRLICPFSIESVLSLIPSTQTISKAPDAPRPSFESGVTIVDDSVNEYLHSHYFEGVTRPTGYFVDVTTILAIIWAVGIAVLFVYAVVSYLRVKNKVATAVVLRDNVFQSENVISPFVLGIIKPKIYLPFNMKEQDAEQVIAHEKAHICRRDYLWKPIGFMILALHWFNPLMWLGYILLCRDIELACDEKVVKKMNAEQKADYSQALLTCSVNRRMISACPLAFGETDVKNRVKSVLNYKKPTFWIVLVAVILSIAVAICFLTNPKKDTDLGINSQKCISDMEGISIEIIDADSYAPSPFIRIKWTNDTDKKITYGDEFYIYRNANGMWRDCRKGEYIWHLLGYFTLPNSTSETDYNLSELDMTQSGKYRFETNFSVEGEENRKYNIQLEFEIENGILNSEIYGYKPIELVYNDGMYSYIQTVDAAPTFMLMNGMELYEKYSDAEISLPLGKFEEITLDWKHFDSRFMGRADYSWQSDETLEKLKKNNKRIWQLYSDETAQTPHLYLLLEQNDGTLYMGCGSYNNNSVTPINPDDSHIRWLYKLEKISISNVGGTGEPVNTVFTASIEHLKAKYPTFFNIAPDNGLKIYIWQMSKNNYNCYLTNTTLDSEFLFDVGATLTEMRTILSTYNVDKNDIEICPVRSMLSSYYYEIDNNYRAEVTKLFWDTTPYKDQSLYTPIIDTATFDVDGDGKDEHCSLSYGPTSGRFTFVLSVSENGRLEYYNTYDGIPGEMSFEITSDASFLRVLPNGESNPIDYSFSVQDGNIVLNANNKSLSYWGSQGVDSNR